MNLFSNDECSAKSGTPQFKEAGPAVRLTCPERPSGANEGKSVPKDLLQLSQLVGDPNTEERVWMNACIGAGARSLEPRHGAWYKSFSYFKTSLGATYGMLTILLNFCLGLFIAAQSAFVLRGVNLDDFIRPFSSIDGSGLLIALLTGLCFWVSLLSKSKVIRLGVIVPSIFLLALALVVGASQMIGYTWATLTAAVFIALFLAISHAGVQLRESLPAGFSAVKLAQSGLGMLTVPAALSAWILCQAITQPSHSTSYDNGSSGSLMLMGWTISYCLLAQGYALGRASKSLSKSACAFLGVCMQAPLLAGLFYPAVVSTLIAVMANVDPNFASAHSNFATGSLDVWKTIGPDKAMFMFASTLATLGLAASGGYFGAWQNGLLQRAKNK